MDIDKEGESFAPRSVLVCRWLPHSLESTPSLLLSGTVEASFIFHTASAILRHTNLPCICLHGCFHINVTLHGCAYTVLVSRSDVGPQLNRMSSYYNSNTLKTSMVGFFLLHCMQRYHAIASAAFRSADWYVCAKGLPGHKPLRVHGCENSYFRFPGQK